MADGVDRKRDGSQLSTGNPILGIHLRDCAGLIGKILNPVSVCSNPFF
jgi:hypothetical protein